MRKYREAESLEHLDNVISTAMMVPSMVAVITGGDPITRPERARILMQRISFSKALVLDTSGAGDISLLIDDLRKHRVHVRVSLDSVSPLNDKLRPENKVYSASSSALGARRTIRACLDAGLSVTVQSVVSSKNENIDELRNLRDWLIGQGVLNWVLHVVVKGGSARRIEASAIKRRRPSSLLPSPDVYSLLWRLISETIDQNLPIDIRCTDTGATPNSVLLVGSTGDLFTEGLAHQGKVRLYDASSERPDKLRSLWSHFDRFGHVRRYLNWNPWFFEGRSLEKICYDVPVPEKLELQTQIVESETKHRVNDRVLLDQRLQSIGYLPGDATLQRDEYYDSPDRTLTAMDWVVRIRVVDGSTIAGVKGPRSYSAGGAYSRIELELSTSGADETRAELRVRGLILTWVLDKRRTEYRREGCQVVVAVDEIPLVGVFVEVEGPSTDARPVRKEIQSAIGPPDRRNYAEVVRDAAVEAGHRRGDVRGAEFDISTGHFVI